MKDIKLPIPSTENEESQFPFYPSGSSIILCVLVVVNYILDVQVRATIQDGLRHFRPSLFYGTERNLSSHYFTERNVTEATHV